MRATTILQRGCLIGTPWGDFNQRLSIRIRAIVNPYLIREHRNDKDLVDKMLLTTGYCIPPTIIKMEFKE